MVKELLLWGAVFLVPLAALITFFWVRRIRIKRHWHSKRPIHVQVRRDPEREV